MHRVLTEGRVVALSNHMMLVARDGSERPIADSAAPIQDESGAVLGAVLVFRDIAEEREQKRELQRLAAIVSSSSDAIIGESLEGEVTAWNAGAEALFGYSAAEVIGRSVSLLDPPEAEDTTLSRLDRIRKGQRVRQFDTTRLHKDGHRVAVSVSVSPIHDAEGHIVGASKIIRDITERKEAELALRASEERFRVLSSAVTSLVWVCDENGRRDLPEPALVRVHRDCRRRIPSARAGASRSIRKTWAPASNAGSSASPAASPSNATCATGATTAPTDGSSRAPSGSRAAPGRSGSAPRRTSTT